MFSRIASVLYSAVDALAPPLPLQEEFIWHWEATANFYTDKRSSGKTPIESTTIPNHLNQMLTILDQERQEYASDTPGPCLEYLLQHKLLDAMCVLARADTPPGMKRYVFNFVRRLLELSNFSLLPHVRVYSCVQKLIKLCGESLASPSERDEIFFLQMICEKLHQNPQLVNFFITNCSNDINVRKLSVSSQSSSESNDNKISPQFPLVKSLLTLLRSPDSDVTDCAAECLTVCCMFPNERSSEIIVQHTNMCSSIINQLTVLYKNIPSNLKPPDIDEALSKWNSDPTVVTNASLSPSGRKLLCFFRWLDFVNKLMSQAYEPISCAIGVTFQNDFLENYLYTDLISEDCCVTVFCTSLISACVSQLGHSALTTYLCSFLLGNISEPEIPGFSNHSLKDLLIERCRNTPDYPLLSLATMQLFEDLLRKPTESVLNSLILCNLVSRSYFDNTSVDDYFSLSEDEEDSEAFAAKYLNQEYEDGPSPGTKPSSNTFAPKHINKILNCFLLLLPEEIKSSESEDDSGYEVYVKDAQRQFHECLIACEDCDWPMEPLKADLTSGEEDESSDSQPEADHSSHQFFFEGSFLSMIFDKLEHILEQPYEVNLQVTSLISKLALIPHPNLHEYLLNPFIPLSPGSRSLFVVLLKVVEEIQISIQNIPNFKKELKLMRRTLLSDDLEQDVQNIRFSSASTLEALIVVEEFCKELAAIAFIKSHAAS